VCRASAWSCAAAAPGLAGRSQSPGGPAGGLYTAVQGSTHQLMFWVHPAPCGGKDTAPTATVSSSRCLVELQSRYVSPTHKQHRISNPCRPQSRPIQTHRPMDRPIIPRTHLIAPKAPSGQVWALLQQGCLHGLDLLDVLLTGYRLGGQAVLNLRDGGVGSRQRGSEQGGRVLRNWLSATPV
jgi:hypothetical protein